ncbi:MAG TPA: hypothetical protein VM165_21875 [Planctomycetaceae bacterium]|nr:hypothetical protein [Planctomycetaceae bacterium]
MDDSQRLDLIAEAVRYCQRVKALGMPVACYTKALREPVHFLWERRAGSKMRCARFCSKDATGLRFGTGQLIYDHAVPFSYLQQELLSLDPVTAEGVAGVLGRFGTVVLITESENARLNAAGYGRKMPANWDGADPLARYRSVGIEVLEIAERPES